MPLNPKNIPSRLIALIPLAEKWGVGDDFEREAAISNASRQELESLLHSIDNIPDEDLYGWLAGPESFSQKPSAEYLALTCLTMAIDSARAKLKRMS